MRIRHATVDDADALRSMGMEFIKEEHEAGSPMKPGERTAAWIAKMLGVLIEKQFPGSVLIAEEGEEAIAFTAFYVDPFVVDHEFTKSGRVFVSYVRPSHRRSGLAVDMVAIQERDAAALGCDVMHFSVRLNNEASLGLARKVSATPHDVLFYKALPRRE